ILTSAHWGQTSVPVTLFAPTWSAPTVAPVAKVTMATGFGVQNAVSRAHLGSTWPRNAPEQETPSAK
uniref:PPE family protein n=1 Tax=Macrostomum lignano TaxID=282301 RepID=A0A1I8IWQ5_9PLAT